MKRVGSCGHAAAVLFVFGLVASAGCTKQEKLYRVSGVVTHGGKAIPKGLIFFDPKADGPQGFANIVEGKYDTAVQGKGIRGGSYNIRDNDFDGKEAKKAPFSQPLFPEHNGRKYAPQSYSQYALAIA